MSWYIRSRRGIAATLSIATVGVLASLSQARAAQPFAPVQRYAAVGAFGRAQTQLAPADRGIAADVAHGKNVRDMGRLGGNKTIEVGLLMRVRNLSELQTLTRLQGTPRSPYYHHYLSTAQYDNYFALDAGSYARTIATLQRRGFRITATYPNRSFLRAAAPAAAIERYFSTQLHAVYQAKHGVRYMNVTPAVMPPELRSVAVSVSGLHSIVTMQHPIQLADRGTVLRSQQFAAAKAYTIKHAQQIAQHLALIRSISAARRKPLNVPTPLSTATGQPGADATEVPGDPTTDYVNSIGGYDPTIYADAYDYPVQHGYGGKYHPTASVIDADFANSDANSEVSTFAVPRTGNNYRECGDPNGGPTCDGLIGAGDPEGESTLDALTIISLAPAADFYEYLAPGFDDLAIEGAYEAAINQDVADVVNSSFGGCETDDPSFGYASNFIAMEGAALGITFSASTGDTGAESCGLYAMNGAPQTEVNISIPSGGYYFTALGGSDFFPITACTGVQSACYTHEDGWTFGGGGHSVINPMPDWQAAVIAAQTVTADVSTAGRNTPDVVFTADELPPGVGMDIFLNGSQAAIGGTSVASPMFTALQSEINEFQKSRNGWVNPGLYTAFTDFNSLTTNFGFRDITGGDNVSYAAVPGYDDATGLGSPLGWNLAQVENGYPGATPRPSPATPPPVPAASPTPLPTATPVATPVPTPHPSGTGNVVTTIAGKTCAMPGTSVDNASPELACFSNPAAIAYVASGATDAQSMTDNYLFITDLTTGFLRAIDLSTPNVVTENSTTWNNATRAKAGTSQSLLYGLALAPAAATTFDGLYVVSAGDTSFVQVTLPTTPTADTPATSAIKALSSEPAGAAWSNTGTMAGISALKDDTFHLAVFTPVINDDLTNAILPSGGNYGVAYDTANLEFYVTDNTQNSITSVLPTAQESMATLFVSGAPLNLPKGITYLNSSFYVANCGGNDIVKVTSAGVMSITAGDGAPMETDGDNTGAEFDCPFGITNDGTNLYVTDLSGNTIREITNVQ